MVKRLYLIISVLLVMNIITLTCRATEDIGSEAYFIGFMGDKQEYALVLICSIYGPMGDNDASLFTLNMGKSSLDYLEPIKIDKSNSSKLQDAFDEGNYLTIWEYYLSTISKFNKKIFGEKFILNTKIKSLQAIPIDKELLKDKKWNIKKNSMAKFRVDQNNVLIVSVNVIRNKDYFVQLQLTFESIITFGNKIAINENMLNQSCDTKESIFEYPPYIAYPQDSLVPYDLYAYTNNNGQMIVVGALMNNQGLCGTYFPVVAVHPGEKAVSTGKIQSAEELNTLGYRAYKANKLTEALGYFQEAVDADPKIALAHYNLACVLSLSRQREKKEIIDASLQNILYHLEQSIQLDPSRKKRLLEDSDLKPITKTIGFQKLIGISPSDDKNVPFLIQLITWYGTSGTSDYPLKTLKFNKKGKVTLEIVSYQQDKNEKIITELKGTYTVLRRKVFFELQGIEGKVIKYEGTLNLEGVLNIPDLDVFKDNYKEK